jgi:hypothetical protein
MRDERKMGGTPRRVAGLKVFVSSSGAMGLVLGMSLRAVLRSACV